MLLFERVRTIGQHSGISERKLAAALELKQSQLSYYMNADSQIHLWEHLPKILELFPQINKYWLYFEEGEMLAEAKPSQTEVEALRQRVKDLEALLASKDESLMLYREAHARRHPLKPEGIAGSGGNVVHSLRKEIE